MENSPAGRSCSYKYLILMALFIFIADFLTKAAVVYYLPLEIGSPAPHIPLFHNFLWGIDGELTHAINTGAAWGVFHTFPLALLLFRILFVAVLVVYTGVYAEKQLRVPLTLVIAGAIGNIVDYFLYGHVIDMVHLTLYGWDYPVFNIADSAICIGTLWIFVTLFFRRHPQQ